MHVIECLVWLANLVCLCCWLLDGLQRVVWGEVVLHRVARRRWSSKEWLGRRWSSKEWFGGRW